MQLRPYQEEVKQRLYSYWLTNPTDNALITMPTGAGKTVLMSSVIHDHNVATCAIAHRQELVGQISQALAREGVMHRIIAPPAVRSEIVREHTHELGQAFHDPTAQVGVAGVDTLNRRVGELRSWMLRVGLWVTDEAHHLLQNNKWGKAAELFPNARGLGVTATPLRADGAGLGRSADGVFDTLIEGPDMRWLIDNNYLTDYRIFAPPSDFKIDDQDIGTKGDWSTPKMKKASEESHIVGDVVQHYLRITPGKKAVVFSTDIDTSSHIADQFTQAGISASVISSRNTITERNRIMHQFKNGQLDVLVNVDLFGEGFDLPAIEVVIMARPTASYGLYVQQFGRALRLMNGKKEAYVIDHVGNVTRHGLPDKQRIWSLNRVEKRSRGERDPDLIPTRVCTECTSLYEAIYDACPYCDEPYVPAGRSKPEQVDGNLFELSPEALREMRGEVDRIDIHNDDMRKRLVAGGFTGAQLGGALKNHRNRQEAQSKLREIIALWAGYQRHLQRPDSESYKRFYWRYGIDVMSAQALGRADADALTEKISADLYNNKL